MASPKTVRRTRSRQRAQEFDESPTPPADVESFRNRPRGTVQPRVPMVLANAAHTVQSGTVVRLVPDRGFGFIRPEPFVGDEYFFHVSGVIGGAAAFSDLVQGQRVEYHVVTSAKGARAINVRPLTGESGNR